MPAQGVWYPESTIRNPEYGHHQSILTYFKIGFWDGLSPDSGGGLFYVNVKQENVEQENVKGGGKGLFQQIPGRSIPFTFSCFTCYINKK